MRLFTHKDKKLGHKVGGVLLTLSELRAIPAMSESEVPNLNQGMFREAMEGFREPTRWHGTTDPKKLASRAAGEWKGGRDSLRKLEQDLTGAATTLGVSDCRRKIAWADQGDEIDIHRVYSGDLDTAWQTTRRNGTGLSPIVSIVSGWGGVSNVTNEQLFWSGAAALVAANILESAGYSVEIMAANCARQDGPVTSVAAIRLKNADTPLEMMSIAASMCFGGVFRSLGFAAKCLQPHARIDSGFGSTRDPRGMELSKWPTEGQPVAIGNTYSREAALAAVKEILHSVETGVFTD